MGPAARRRHHHRLRDQRECVCATRNDLLSAATGDLVIDQLPANTWLTDGAHPAGFCIAKNGLSSCVIETYARVSAAVDVGR